MNLRQILSVLVLMAFASFASADLTPYEDYDIGEGVSNVTTVKVDSNMIDAYLEGISRTWAPANDVAIELGQIESYSVFVSQLPNGGEFNVVLVVNMKDASSLQPSQEQFEAFMQAWGEENQAVSDEVVPTYPGIRTITGEYLMREITFK